MPTGYTNKVSNGEITEAKDYILSVATGYGAMMGLNIDKLDKDGKHHKPSNYHLERLENAIKELEKFSLIKDEEFLIEIKENYIQSVESHKKYIEEKAVIENRYLKMLNKVKEWEVPTEEHQKLKESCMEQLENSIKWDCETSHVRTPKMVEITKYKDVLYKQIVRDIGYHSKAYNDEMKRVEDCNKWINDLLNSF